MTTSTAARPAPADAVLTAAVDAARAAAEEVAAAGHVGEHLGTEMEAERLVAHRFACLDPAYRGWYWAVTLTRVPRSRTVTVCESVLLPGADALLAQEWLPWSKRLVPGDLGVGDLLPTEADDERLEPGYQVSRTDDLDSADDDTDRVAVWELGLGRARVLSPLGRDEAVERWYNGDHGPQAPIAKAAPDHCSSCGFVVPLGGSLRRLFGVCANEYSPDDGQVVSYDHGCGAHSEVAVLPPPVPVTEPLTEESDVETVDLTEPGD